MPHPAPASRASPTCDGGGQGGGFAGTFRARCAECTDRNACRGGFQTRPYTSRNLRAFARSCAPFAAHVRFTISENMLLYTTFVSLSRTFFAFSFLAHRFVCYFSFHNSSMQIAAIEIVPAFPSPVNPCNIRLRSQEWSSWSRHAHKGSRHRQLPHFC